ncbi:MAG: SMI1/KNR4 family protein [Pseudomonadota bacterium]|nr:SMI1/KNR4 family protein [Pseudomonadota bacterium]
MQIFPTLRQLIAHKADPDLAGDAVIQLPQTLLPDQSTTDWAPLLGPKARFLVQDQGAASRPGYRPWLTIGGLRRIAEGLEHDFGDSDLLAALALHLNPAPAPEPPTADHPPLQWPTLADDEARLRWYHACIHATQACITPASRAELDVLEDRLKCALPPFLRLYHQRLGTLDLPERLCSVQPDGQTPIAPLINAYPGIRDIVEPLAEPDRAAALARVDALIAFGDYLGNGNLFCFHRQTGAVWYFDHDTPPMLTPMFDTVTDYLDALMIKALAQTHGASDDATEQLLRERFDEHLVRQWMY